jgi:quercetin dioxygenase-like cupin family protein
LTTLVSVDTFAAVRPRTTSGCARHQKHIPGVTMSTFRIVQRDRIPAKAALGKDGESYALVDVGDDEHPELSRVRHMHPGSDVELQLFEATLPPGTEAGSHAHMTDEIIFVLDGEMIVGARTLGPGDSVYIGAETLYAFKAGATGLRFLNFRGRHDDTHLSKEELMVRRAGRATAKQA